MKINNKKQIDEQNNKINIISIKNYKKKYQGFVLNIPSFDFERGKIYLVVGHNGCGKSTLIKSILGLVKYEGIITINTKKIAYMPERLMKLYNIKVIDYIKMILSLDKKRIDNCFIQLLLDKYNLDKNKKLSELSKGMLQKVNIIVTFLLDKDLILLDEPINGLDNNTKKDFFELINNENKRGKSIIIISHYNDFSDFRYYKLVKIEEGSLCSL
ncbi:MAG: ATP-binding cassette domain-containing protein [Bacilli bacterium]|nr:ATP-binding cassette domain-containing protein [Bacilli bacterium]